MTQKHNHGRRQRTHTRLAIDKFIGDRLRQFRAGSGLTQAELAIALGISHQQVQKYETGANGISAARLMEISHVLGVAPTAFLPATAAPPMPEGDRHGGIHRAHIAAIKNYEALSPTTQSAINTLIKTLAAEAAPL